MVSVSGQTIVQRGVVNTQVKLRLNSVRSQVTIAQSVVQITFVLQGFYLHGYNHTTHL